MPTSLSEMLASFGIEPADDGGTIEKTAAQVDAGDQGQEERLTQLLDGHEKTGSDGGHAMSLRDMWVGMQARDEDLRKEASVQGEPSVEAGVPANDEPTSTGEVDLEKIAYAEAEEHVAIEKQAEELDAAGRIMARGYMDELMKLSAAATEDVHTTPNAIEPASADKGTASGPRGTDFQVPTNFAGTHGKHDKPISTAGSREAYKDVLKDGGNTTVGSGVTMTPPAVGRFATVKDMMG